MIDCSIKLKLITFLSDGNMYSGEKLGRILGISRAAVNKHISQLKEWGLNIHSMPSQGYILLTPIQLLDSVMILSKLNNPSISIINIVDSTNQYLLERIDILQSGDTCIAEYQQAGRGRRGRQWFSPFGANLYLSMYWRLDQGPESVVGLSLVVSVILAEVLWKIGITDIRVKWPNDIYLYDRKVGGILVELIGATGDTAKIVIGIGINISMYTSNNLLINQNWINLDAAGIQINRNELAAQLINHLRYSLYQFEQQGFNAFIKRWLKLDNFINRPVKLLLANQEVYGISRGIDRQGRLLLEQANGKIKSWVSGDISLRIQQKD
ncbi:bifunctional biotin--[acetyl-CoA-carboxylase] ligase/biotin operon repressor BirA [Candidatus Ishikawella capsulata]|uniref:bifunctional biotin--[acetyl-CoA-carboxylase] ligase/biotin operon repressor BirA n=1 Tax=Candidatus Ishikawella capsulata TaxID=168169 RepID=UPI000597C6E5|nr:bifunctional biotin--[acetyl-CoA-carboxylase] ligase/biotin operon repressor BirA [Candidatus Ishikawaella capsulata]